MPKNLQNDRVASQNHEQDFHNLFDIPKTFYYSERLNLRWFTNFQLHRKNICLLFFKIHQKMYRTLIIPHCEGCQYFHFFPSISYPDICLVLTTALLTACKWLDDKTVYFKWYCMILSEGCWILTYCLFESAKSDEIQNPASQNDESPSGTNKITHVESTTRNESARKAGRCLIESRLSFARCFSFNVTCRCVELFQKRSRRSEFYVQMERKLCFRFESLLFPFFFFAFRFLQTLAWR